MTGRDDFSNWQTISNRPQIFREDGRMRVIILALLVIVFAGRHIKADERPVIGEGFVMYPVTTLLQRMQLARNGAELPRIRVYVAVNGAGVIAEDGSIDANALSIRDLANSLAGISGRDDGTVVVALYLDRKSSNPAAGKLIELALDGLGRRSGFEAVHVRTHFENGRLDWAKTVGWATQPLDGPPNDDETPVGDEDVQVFPVRTGLSRFLTGGADCVVDIRAPFGDKRNPSLKPDVQESVVKNVAALQFNRKHQLLFRVKSSEDAEGRDRAMNFVGAESKDLAEKLGFKSSSVQIR
jgi:hypothetical protein